VQFDETTILDRDKGFMTVRYLVMRGPNFEIGRKLGEIAMGRHGLRRDSLLSSDPLITGVRKKYFEVNYPIHMERSRGAAYALGVDPADDDHDPTVLPYNQEMGSGSMPLGCSVVYYPPSTTANGHGLLSRNFDFPKVSLAHILGLVVSGEPERERPPAMADPYVIEMYPEDSGYASLCLLSFDLLSGVLDGINSEGLAVSVNGDEVAMNRGPEPNVRGVGLNELQGMRLLLDTCATVEEAKEALLCNKQFYSFIPCHYIIADRHGKAFVFEPSHGRNNEYFIEATDSPMIVTNHPLYVYQSISDFPEETGPLEAGTSSFERYMRLVDLITDAERPYTIDTVKEINAGVSVSKTVSWVSEEKRREYAASPALARTLWHCVYDCVARSLDIKFYLRDEPAGGGNFTEHYSDYFWFVLEG
jgi:hypothetical protein